MGKGRGVVELLRSAVTSGTKAVEDVHLKMLQRRYDALLQVIGDSDEARVLIQLEKAGTQSVYAVVTACADAVGALTGELVGRLESGKEGSSPGNAAKEIATSQRYFVPILNGVVGDFLKRKHNPLATKMVFLHDHRPLTPPYDSIPREGLSPKVVILVHGLVADETVWLFPESPERSYGSLLEQEGYTPFYLRYNSGLHISENAREFATLLEELVANYPIPITQLVFIGHSLGGLLLRAATWYAAQNGHRWIEKADKMIYIASPHHGAPMERAGNLLSGLLKSVGLPYIQIVGEIADCRSAGIKDLRYGYLTDEEWKNEDQGAVRQNNKVVVPQITGVQHYAVIGGVTEDPGHPLTAILGDMIVPTKSAQGIGSSEDFTIPFTDMALFPGLGHMKLSHHIEVYMKIREWCQKPGE